MDEKWYSTVIEVVVEETLVLNLNTRFDILYRSCLVIALLAFEVLIVNLLKNKICFVFWSSSHPKVSFSAESHRRSTVILLPFLNDIFELEESFDALVRSTDIFEMKVVLKRLNIISKLLIIFLLFPFKSTTHEFLLFGVKSEQALIASKEMNFGISLH